MQTIYKHSTGKYYAIKCCGTNPGAGSYNYYEVKSTLESVVSTTLYPDMVENTKDWILIDKNYKVKIIKDAKGNTTSISLQPLVFLFADSFYRVENIHGIDFTIGDWISVIGTQIKGKIASFSFNQEKSLFVDTSDDESYLLDIVTVIEGPVLITRDGVPKWVGDTVHRSDHCSVSELKVTSGWKDYYNNTDLKFFSTKQAADIYKLENDSKLSLSDISKTLSTHNISNIVQVLIMDELRSFAIKKKK